jgi:hypothetical protein
MAKTHRLVSKFKSRKWAFNLFVEKNLPATLTHVVTSGVEWRQLNPYDGASLNTVSKNLKIKKEKILY